MFRRKKRVGTAFFVKGNNIITPHRIKCGRGDCVGFLYVFGLMFLTIFGAVMLLYPLFKELFRVAGRKYSVSDNDSTKRNVKR